MWQLNKYANVLHCTANTLHHRIPIRQILRFCKERKVFCDDNETLWGFKWIVLLSFDNPDIIWNMGDFSSIQTQSLRISLSNQLLLTVQFYKKNVLNMSFSWCPFFKPIESQHFKNVVTWLTTITNESNALLPNSLRELEGMLLFL